MQLNQFELLEEPMQEILQSASWDRCKIDTSRKHEVEMHLGELCGINSYVER